MSDMVSRGLAAYWPDDESITGPLTNGERMQRALLAALDPEDDGTRDVCAAILRDKGPLDLTVVEAQRCVNVVLNALRSCISQGGCDGRE